MEFERNALCSMLMDLMTNFASRLASAPPKVAQKDLDVFKTIVGDIQRYKFVSDVLRGREDELASHTREPKNDNEANAARERGNDLFKRGSYAEALKAYNEGIVYAAPESLPLFFANRSAVLVELNRPGDALKDIDRAFAYGYQKNIAFKLHFRKAKILLELGNVQDASKEVQDGKDSLSLLSVDAVTAEWGRRFDELETDLSNTKRRKERKKSKLPGGRGSPKSYFEDYRVNYSPHPTYVSASATVDVRYSKENGRSMYAKKDLKPGDVLIVEKPYVYFVPVEVHKTHCQNCCAWCALPIPCLSCANVVFCSEACRDVDPFHETECPFMNGIYSLSNRHAIVFRTIAKKTLAEWKEFAAANPGGDGEDDDFPAVNTSDKYDPDDYVNVYRLRKNSEQRRLANPELLYNFARYSVQLVDLLKRTHFKDESVIDPELEAWLGGLALRHYQNSEVNGSQVFERVGSPSKIKDHETSVPIATALYPTISLLNSSCSDNTTFAFYGVNAVVMAKRLIKAGEEITTLYCASSLYMPRPARQKMLKKKYQFDCRCVACVEDWPTMDVLSFRAGAGLEEFNCPECGRGGLTVDSGTCPRCRTDVVAVLERLEKRAIKYRRLPTIREQFEEQKKMMTEAGKFLVMPSSVLSCMQHEFESIVMRMSNTRDL